MAATFTTTMFNAAIDNRAGHGTGVSDTVKAACKTCFASVRTAVVGGSGSDNQQDVVLAQAADCLYSLAERVASNYRA